MASSTLRVELPAYSHTFQVSIPPLSTIRDVKYEITKVCPGSPSPEGQRVIWKGRLLKDEEKVEDIWKSSEESRVVHLAVNPSAWTSTPPPLPISPPTSGSTFSGLRSTPTVRGHPAPIPSWQLLSQQPVTSYSPVVPLPAIFYIDYVHNTALAVLSTGATPLPPSPTATELEAWRFAAEEFYRIRGWSWPSIFDEPCSPGPTLLGTIYRPVTLEGLPYLQLLMPSVVPDSLQARALKILTYTFPILSMVHDPLLYAPVNPYPIYPHTPSTNLNQHLQQLGLPALRFAQNQMANPNPNGANPLAQPGAGVAEIRAIPMRALVLPLLMLAFRALLMLYFFSPTKRPVFGLLISVWILYETWNALRMVLNEGNERGAEGGGANPAGPNAAPGPGQAAPQPGNAANTPNTNAPFRRFALQGILDYLSTINLAAEDAILDTDAPHPPPSLGQKAKVFFALFFVTLHPAAWDRRRNALRQREGRIRTDANAREAVRDANGDANVEGQTQARSEEAAASARAREQLVARHERRPAWLKEYVSRVHHTEWMDDL